MATYQRQLQFAARLEEDVAGDDAYEVRACPHPGFVVQLIEQGERVFDSARGRKGERLRVT